jgi:hypothetical protein
MSAGRSSQFGAFDWRPTIGSARLEGLSVRAAKPAIVMDNADSSLDLRTIVPSPPDLGQAAAREQGWWREGRISPVLYWTRTIQDQRARHMENDG